MKKQDHLEVSDGDTCIASSSKCPIESDVKQDQIFNETVCCCIRGQRPTDFVCPSFYGAVFSDRGFSIDCRP